MTRRRWLLCSLGGLVSGMSGVAGANAGGKLTRATVSYQDHPNGSKQCSTCSHYIPATASSEAGRCQIVAGPVGPQGYCIVWADRNPRDDGCA